jgi:hypothetical protein
MKFSHLENDVFIELQWNSCEKIWVAQW